MKKFLMIALVLFSSATFATQYTVDAGGSLTAEQKAQIQLQAAQLAAKNTETPKPPVQAAELTEWVNFGKAIGSGLAGTAEELGVAADKIADTRVGTFAMVLIAWHYAGEEFVSIVFGFLWLLTIIPVWIWMYRRQFIVDSITWYEKGKREDGKRKVVSFCSANHGSGELRFMYWLTLLFIMAIGILPVLF